MAVLRSSLIICCILAASQANILKQGSNDIEEVEKYIEAKKPEINPRYRPHYHVAPPVGWMNDPNGFSFFRGEYHLFYQFYPYDSAWGPMHWGHVSSPDLVHWKQLPTALVPEEEQCFSGSAVVDGDTLVLMYTAHEITDVEPFYNETQYLAYSEDGITFHKYEGNPVLEAAPNGSPDFRDPKVWRHEDHWYVVIGSKTDDQRGRVLLYRSEDMKEWEFLSVIGESDGDMGYMWECPDFFEIEDGRYVLLMSPQGLEPQGDRFKNTYQTGYIIGKFNYDTFEFEPETEFQEIDFGHDFYASQTAEVDGRRYVLAWFSMWEVPLPEDVDGWAGTMTLARELRFEGDRAIMRPVVDGLRDLNVPAIHGFLWKNDNVELHKASEVKVFVDGRNGLELLLEGTEGGDQVWLRWDPEIGKVVVDRNGDIRQTEWSTAYGLSWTIYLDASSLELFCGGGEVVFSSRVYSEGDWRLTSLGDTSVWLEAYALKRTVPEP